MDAPTTTTTGFAPNSRDQLRSAVDECLILPYDSEDESDSAHTGWSGSEGSYDTIEYDGEGESMAEENGEGESMASDDGEGESMASEDGEGESMASEEGEGESMASNDTYEDHGDKKQDGKNNRADDVRVRRPAPPK